MAYFSNGTEGEVFEDQCAKCKYGDKPCPIALVQNDFNYEQKKHYVASRMLNMLVNQKGECAMFKTFKSDFWIDGSCEQQSLF